VRRLACFALIACAATAGIDWPAPAGAERVRYADLFAAAAALAFALSWVGRESPAAWLRREGPRLWVGGALGAALGLAAWTALSAFAHGAGGSTALGALELAVVFGLAAALGGETAVRDRVLQAWMVGAAVACAVGLAAAGMVVAGMDPAPLHAGGGELGLGFRPAGLCRTGMLAAWSLVPAVLLWLDGARLAGRARLPLLALLGTTLALTLTRTLLAVPFALLLASRRRGLRLAGGALLAAAALASLRIDVHGSAEPGIRWRIAASALERAAAHPLLGVGPDAGAARAGWPRSTDPRYTWDAHSTLLDVAATRGLPAAALFTAAAALAWRASRRAPADSTQLALRAGLGAVLFDALTIDAADFRHLWLLLGLFAARGASQRLESVAQQCP
jgi:hypothetical protein